MATSTAPPTSTNAAARPPAPSDSATTTDQHRLAELSAHMPFAETVGARLVAAGTGAVVGELDWAPDRCTVGGVMHGGALMTLADSVGAVCAHLNLPAGAAGTATIESKTNLVGAVREGTAVATAHPVHVGRTTIVVQTEIRVGDRLVALTTQTQSVLGG